METPRTLRLAVAQIEVSEEVPTSSVVAAAGARVRALMERAAEADARVVQFPEGTLTYPSKYLMSGQRPEIGEADWTRADWSAIRSQLLAVGDLARELGIWTVIGAPHQLANGPRPHNSLYVFSDTGELVGNIGQPQLHHRRRVGIACSIVARRLQHESAQAPQ